MKLVVDATAVLAVCKKEAGMEEARRKMRGGFISAVNLSEVYCIALKVNKRQLVDAIVQAAELVVVPFDKQLASLAASLESQTRDRGISFADRSCLALGMHKQLPVLTADHVWGELDLNVELDFFRPQSK